MSIRDSTYLVQFRYGKHWITSTETMTYKESRRYIKSLRNAGYKCRLLRKETKFVKVRV